MIKTAEEGIQGRLRLARHAAGLSMREAAERTGVPARTISNYELGEHKPSIDYIVTICTCFGINANWLLTGEGPMLKDQRAGLGQVNTVHLETILQAIIDYTTEAGRKLTAEQIAKLAALFYRHFNEAEHAGTANIVDLDAFRIKLRESCALAVNML